MSYPNGTRVTLPDGLEGTVVRRDGEWYTVDLDGGLRHAIHEDDLTVERTRYLITFTVYNNRYQVEERGEMDASGFGPDSHELRAGVQNTALGELRKRFPRAGALVSGIELA